MSIHDKRYVSKSLHLTVNISNDVYAYVTDEQGHTRERVTEPALVVEFDNLMTRSSHSENARYDRAFATRYFFPKAAWRDSGQAPGHSVLGALPSMTPQALYEPGPNGTQKLAGMTDGYDPTLHFGVFYLDWIPDLKRRDRAEKALDAHGLAGVEYLKVVPEALPKPWPTYDDMRKGAGADKAILAACKTMGINPFIVIEYENAQTDPKPGVLARMQELADEVAEAAADEASLERVL